VQRLHPVHSLGVLISGIIPILGSIRTPLGQATVQHIQPKHKSSFIFGRGNSTTPLFYVLGIGISMRSNGIFSMEIPIISLSLSIPFLFIYHLISLSIFSMISISL